MLPWLRILISILIWLPFSSCTNTLTEKVSGADSTTISPLGLGSAKTVKKQEQNRYLQLNKLKYHKGSILEGQKKAQYSAGKSMIEWVETRRFPFLKAPLFSQFFGWNEESCSGCEPSAVHRTMRRRITTNRIANKMPIAHHCRRSVRAKSSEMRWQHSQTFRPCSNMGIYYILGITAQYSTWEHNFPFTPIVVNHKGTNHKYISKTIR